MDALACCKFIGMAINAQCLHTFTHKVHFDAALVFIVEGMVAEGTDVDITLKFPVNTL